MRGDPCLLSTQAAEPLDTLTIVLSDSADFSHDPIPSNDSEQLLFPQQFEMLVRLDCRGQLRPGLARAWTADRTGRVWTFVLGDPVAPGSLSTATRIASTWRTRDALMREIGIDSVGVLDGNRLVATLNQLAATAPNLFAHPGLAIPRSQARPSGLLRFRVQPGSDPRDALDRGGDLLVTRDPALLDYVAGRPEFTSFPLPWTRTHVLVQPAGAEPLELVLGERERRSLARDAVSADARAAESPFWWTEAGKCPSGETSNPSPASARIVYPRGDEVARGLAGRIVALAGAGAGLRVAALEPADFTTVLRNGAERAFVLSLPRRTLAPCREIVALPRPARIQPLIETRAHVIVRQGAPPLTVEWDGTVRVIAP